MTVAAPPFDLRIDAPIAVVDRMLRPVTVGVRAGRVAELTQYGTPLPAAHVEALGADVVLLPGLVDSHVHVNEPGHLDWEGFDTATRAAAAGGITAIIDMPLDSDPVTTTVAALAAKRSAVAGQAWVNVGFWAGIVPSNVDDRDELGALADAGVAGFKCFLSDSGNAGFPPLDGAQLRVALATCRDLNVPLLVHAESDPVLRAAPVITDGARYADFLAARPDAAEVAAVAEVIDGVRATGARAHIVHVSSAEVLEPLTAAQTEGLAITAETCPHYLVFNAAQIADGQTEFACCPPIRGAANARSIWDGLRAGVLSMIVSDHSPATVAAKRTGDFQTAWGGVSSLQLTLAAVWTAAAGQGVGLPEIAGWMAQSPARLAGLPDHGAIRTGAVANFCVFDPSATWRVEAESLWHRQPVTPYAGRTLRGVVRATWLRGRRVDLSGEPFGGLLSEQHDGAEGQATCASL